MELDKRTIIIISVISLVIIAIILGLVFGLRGNTQTNQPVQQQVQQPVQQPIFQQPVQQPIFQQPVQQQVQQPIFQQPVQQQVQQPIFQQPVQPQIQPVQQPIYDPLPSYVPTAYGRRTQQTQTIQQIQPVQQTQPSQQQSSSNQTGSTGISQEEIDMWISAHNKTRAEVGLGPVTWNQALADGAKKWSNGCVFEHSDSNIRNFNGSILGENLAWGSHALFYSGITGARKLYQGWDDEKQFYTYPAPVGSDTGSKQTGHYTQIVYRPLKEIGCGCSDKCDDGSILCTCRYSHIQQSGRPPY